MFKKYTFITFLYILYTNFPAFAAYDHCTQILGDGVIAMYSNTSPAPQKTIMRDWLCYRVNNSEERDYNAETYIFKNLLGGANAGENNSEVTAWAENYCYDDTSYEYIGSTMDSILINEANENVINKWMACVIDEPGSLACYIEENDENSMVVTILSDYRAVDIEFESDNLDLTDVIVPLYIDGRYSFIVDKSDPEEVAAITIKGSRDGSDGDSVSCNEGALQANSDFGYNGEQDIIPVKDTVEMNQYWNEIIGDHAYVKFRNDAGMANYGYKFEAMVFRIIPELLYEGLTPLYRYWNATGGDHFYTTIRNDSGYGAHGYKFEIEVGYVFTEKPRYINTVAVYEYTQSAILDHYYTTVRNDEGYRNYAGYEYQQIAFYAIPAN